MQIHPILQQREAGGGGFAVLDRLAYHRQVLLLAQNERGKAPQHDHGQQLRSIHDALPSPHDS